MKARRSSIVGLVLANLWVAFLTWAVFGLLAAGVAESYAARGAFWTGGMYAGWMLLFGIPFDCMLLWLARRKLPEPDLGETDAQRAERVVATATRDGSDKLDNDDYAFLMAHVATVLEQKREAERHYQRVMNAYARSSRSLGEPFVYPDPVEEAKDLEKALDRHVGLAV